MLSLSLCVAYGPIDSGKCTGPTWVLDLCVSVSVCVCISVCVRDFYLCEDHNQSYTDMQHIAATLKNSNKSPTSRPQTFRDPKGPWDTVCQLMLLMDEYELKWKGSMVTLAWHLHGVYYFVFLFF